MLNENFYLNFYGIIVKIISNDEECTSFIKSDFSYFLKSSEPLNILPDVTISVFNDQPPYNKIPEGTIASYHTKDAIVYKVGYETFFDSSGKLLVINNYKTNSAEIHSLQHDLLYEKSYLMIMSRVGEILDKKKIPQDSFNGCRL